MASNTVEEARALAMRIAARAEIRDVRALSIQTKLERDPEPGDRLTYQLEQNVGLQWEEGDTEFFATRVAYKLRITDADRDNLTSDADVGGDLLATIDFELAALFALEMRDADEPPGKEELEAYVQSTGTFALYPFARELVYDQTGRLGLPPLTLGIFHIGVKP